MVEEAPPLAEDFRQVIAAILKFTEALSPPFNTSPSGEDQLHKRLIGQDDAVKALAEAQLECKWYRRISV